jgi:Ca2+-transporting ATPase
VGRGEVVVTATGMATEFGRISRLVQTVESGPTPLQVNLDRLGHALGRAALLVVILVVIVGLMRGLPVIEMLVFGIALAVAVVPEALPAVVTISLAIGVRRMVKRHALVRRLPVVETLGSTSVICSDKTGTLTRNEMTVRQIYVSGRRLEVAGTGYVPDGGFVENGAPVEPSPALRALLQAAAQASDALLHERDGQWRIEGDPTEAALVVAARKAGMDAAALSGQEPRTGEIPFTSERRQMTTLHRTRTEGTVAYSKGAFEQVLAGCTRITDGDADVPLAEEAVERLRVVERDMAASGLRVLAVALKPHATTADAEREMTLLGLVGIMDPPREEAAAAVRTCQTAGILPIMITGDHPLTAVAIAREIGLLGERRVVSGRELDATSEADFERDVADIAVYARVTPAQKLRVVEAWQRRGAVVAMTGDGVNDAPALKRADVGVAMGVTGTDVSKEAAGMTLLDDNFATIVAAVEEGRLVFGNIKKYLTYLLSCNVGEVVLLAGSVLAGLPLPLTAVQILYVNLATDGLPALALAVDPPESGLMERSPRNPRTGIFTRPVTMSLLAGGLWSGAANMALFTWLVSTGRPVEQAMAMTFVSLVLIQFFNAYNSRSDRLSILRRPFANRWLNRAVLWELLLLGAVVYVPFLQRAFGTFSLAPGDWLLAAATAFSIVPLLELVKWMARRGWWGELT